jgi:hypothetical protein
MTRRSIKVSIVALSLAATLGSWTAMAQNTTQATSTASGPIVRTTNARPVPTVVRPPASNRFGSSSAQAGALPVIPQVSSQAWRPQPMTRTRSSR